MALNQPFRIIIDTFSKRNIFPNNFFPLYINKCHFSCNKFYRERSSNICETIFFKRNNSEFVCSNYAIYTCRPGRRNFFSSTIRADQNVPRTADEVTDIYSQNPQSPPTSKLLNVAIIGVPNSGKSTLINQLMGWRVCSVSSKVHTTQSNARAVYNDGDTQIVFLDTPGTVTPEEGKKYRLSQSLIVDPEASLQKADLIAVVHDTSNKFTRHRLHSRVLRLLALHPQIPSVLVLNKVDRVKNKTLLLEMVRNLSDSQVNNRTIKTKKSFTESESALKERLLKENLKLTDPYRSDSMDKGYLKVKSDPLFQENFKDDPDKNDPCLRDTDPNDHDLRGSESDFDPLSNSLDQNVNGDFKSAMECDPNGSNNVKSDPHNIDPVNSYFIDDPNESKISFKDLKRGLRPTERQVQNLLEEDQKGWPFFKDVFMVSALEGSGVDDLRNYLKDNAVTKSWIFNDDMITDQSPQEIAIQAVRAKCLENLSYNIPYELKFRVGHWELTESDMISILINVYCHRKPHLKLLIGPAGKKARKISMEAEQDLRNTFRTEVRLKINFLHDLNMK